MPLEGKEQGQHYKPLRNKKKDTERRCCIRRKQFPGLLWAFHFIFSRNSQLYGKSYRQIDIRYHWHLHSAGKERGWELTSSLRASWQDKIYAPEKLIVIAECCPRHSVINGWCVTYTSAEGAQSGEGRCFSWPGIVRGDGARLWPPATPGDLALSIVWDRSWLFVFVFAFDGCYLCIVRLSVSSLASSH